LGLAVDGANRHDIKLLESTLNGVVGSRPLPSATDPQHLCLDKGYDYPVTRELASALGFVLHLRTRGEEIKEKTTIPGYRARRWVVERTHSWMNRFRRILVRWEKKQENYMAMLHFACAWISFRSAEVFG
jgi:transposase